MAILVRLFYLSVSMVLCDEAGRPLCNAHWYRSGHVNWVGFEVNTCWWRLALTLQAILGLYRAKRYDHDFSLSYPGPHNLLIQILECSQLYMNL